MRKLRINNTDVSFTIIITIHYYLSLYHHIHQHQRPLLSHPPITTLTTFLTTVRISLATAASVCIKQYLTAAEGGVRDGGDDGSGGGGEPFASYILVCVCVCDHG